MNLRFLACTLPVITLLSVQQATAQGVPDKKIVKKLKADIGYLASDALEGRRTGTEGERKAADYLVAHYTQAGIYPYKGNYRYSFNFVNGKEIAANSYIRINSKDLRIKEEVFPLPFSANGEVKADVIPEIMEQDGLWMLSLYSNREEANDAHFDWEKSAYDRAKDAQKQGAKAVLFYDSYGARYPAEFNKKSDFESLDIPLAMLTYAGYSNNIKDGNSNITVALNVNMQKTEMTGTNIAAYIDNKAPYTVIIGAHYDHLGYGEDGNSLDASSKSKVWKDGNGVQIKVEDADAKERAKHIHNGADDNASGTAALLQVADWIKNNKLARYNYLFLHFSGEELGLLGSKAFVKDQGIDSSKVAYMINMDMVGRLNDSTHALTVGGVGTSPAWAKMADKNNPDFRIVHDSSGIGPSDHTSFYNVGIPVLFMFTGLHTDYHKPSDDANKINYKGEAQVMKYVYNIVRRMEAEPKPVFTATKQSTVGKVRFKVTLGIMPDYSFQEEGVKVDGVTDGRPASKAGIKTGDVITQLGDIKIKGMQSYMEALSKFAEGDKTEVTVKRGDKELKMPLEFTKQ